ncbi:GntR family transcriptional regulator [Pseudomonas plecoglossicida]|uniref:GntR family transcriptional regulator n=2 Tax=Pseudomonas putida group TaxID=136845 RepID=A0A2A3M9J6_PSEDL|nr:MULTISPECIES: GntR family transcriptional regulator [Pseudomonas]EGC00829.2 GntR family transcriptional regulator [Pseudomonas sp. TJI-51]MBF8700073.1 GntR family transcriptional regulator [Pseudomonas putida]MBF8734663.1 GntR family transcriptional regulator [Pseudomonas putida]MBF8766140.1 GntR family transcriptional regulator [Pseudomonas putida]MDH1927928.1 GntR family transcriptional regulator [Pseudomonas sp. GD03696]
MTSTLKRIQSRTDYVDEVYKALLDAISDGSLAPGARLTQEEIAEQMNISRSPVLQALRLLKKDGLVQDAPGRGLLVTPLTTDSIRNLYQIRGALDNLAAKMAAEQKFQMDQTLIKRGRKASQGRDIKAMIDADMAFHTAIYEASGNPLIAQSAQVYWVHLRRAMGAVLQSSEQREAIWNEHEAIAKAIAAGDVVAAGELTDVHTTHARKNLLERLSHLLMA